MAHQISPEEILLQQLTTIVLTDALPPESHMPAYLYTQTSDNQGSVFVPAIRLSLSGGVSQLLILDDADGTNKGYPGSYPWITHFVSCGVRREKINMVPCFEPLNTFSESLALMKYAQHHHLSKLCIIAPPFHLPRAFISAVSAAYDVGVPTLKIYCQVGATLPWAETVAHSQGTLRGTRRQLIATELQRIHTYEAKGDLVSITRALQYLEWRDSGS